MYPNPQDVLPLPPRPDLGQYRTRAKELSAAARAGDTALLSWATEWIAALDRLQPEQSRTAAGEMERRTHQLVHFARVQLPPANAALSKAQFVIARAHGFASWPRMVQHIEALTESTSDISTFERAADAIITGDVTTLAELLRADPSLARARSDRDHRATLLHYGAANGVENYRQRTPKNIEAVTALLLDAGADVNAEADVYGGGATTFDLVVTSSHPRAAGVQNALADLLLSRGARMNPGIIHYCLMNGCPEAAAHLAERGARLDLVGAAGIGRVDVIAAAFAGDTGPSEAEQGGAMVMAAWYGQQDAIRCMLDQGVDPGVRRPKEGQTALHVAAYQGHAELAELLTARGAPLDVVDAVYGTPPIVWALHAWLAEGRSNGAAYIRIVRALVDAGARVQTAWVDHERLRAEVELYERLRGAVR
jgi:ankyrin repeat protein